MCHNAWPRPMHVGHMTSHVCDTWHAMCVTHGMPCVNMHDTFEGYKYGVVQAGSSKKEKEGKKGEGKKGKKERKREREERKREREERRENERRKEKIKEEERKRRGGKERGKGRSVAQCADSDSEEPGTALQEVGFLLLRFISRLGTV